jgi:hypothetical protein
VTAASIPGASGGRGLIEVARARDDAVGSLTPACMSMVTWAMARRVIWRPDPSTKKAASAKRAKARATPATAASARWGLRRSDRAT